MRWRLELGLSFVLVAGHPALAHERPIINDRLMTPGLRLEMQVVPETAQTQEVKYRFQATGFPKGAKLLLLTREFDHSSRQLASGLQVDRSGQVIVANPGGSGRPRPLDEMSFGPGPYPRGALWEVAVVSVDQKLQAIASTRPYPLEARDGECSVALELVSHRGEKFLATGRGFAPGEEVLTELRYADRVLARKMPVSPDGSLRPQVLLHATAGSDRHARYLVKGRTCEVGLDYVWGAPAVARP